MNPAGFVRILRETDRRHPIGSITAFDFYDHVDALYPQSGTRGVLVFHGEEPVLLPTGSFEIVSAGEAKRWRTEQKKARSLEKRGLSDAR